MRIRFIALAFVCTALASSQTVSSVYNRDTHDPFTLKKVSVESQVVGPMVITSTWLDYDNPYKTPTEATLNFDLQTTAALGGFAYLYGDEYVRGRLMDKKKAWFIYTAITSRNRDPGIMEQWSPTNYHCQIFPIKDGSDLRVRLWSVGLLQPSGDSLVLPRPEAPIAVGYAAVNPTKLAPNWVVHAPASQPVTAQGIDRMVNLSSPVSAVAQKFRDGRVYVAGLLQSSKLPGVAAKTAKVRILRAYYEPQNGGSGGEDVTEKVSSLVSKGAYAISAENRVFGDPTPGVVKRLRVYYSLGGDVHQQVVPENSSLDLLADRAGDGAPSFSDLNEVETVNVNPGTVAFFGWVHHKNHVLTATYQGKQFEFLPQMIGSGNIAPRLWAQQRLANGKAEDALKFSLKYGVPSKATALLAVPAREMALYLKKQRDWAKLEAEQRRRELADARTRRNWAGQRNQNWNATGGGDPEIRVTIAGARSVEALLPDRRVILLTRDGQVWGGNFEVPADAPEGRYEVKILAHMADGSEQARSWSYQVDRTPPAGKARFVLQDGHTVLEVRSEPHLAEVAAYDSTGKVWILHEDDPGIYRVRIEDPGATTFKVVLKNRAGNRTELACSPPR